MHTVAISDPVDDTIPAPTLAAEPFKTCTCGASYTREGWAALDYVGPQVDDVEALELRLCICGTTLAVVVAGAP